MSQRKLAVYVLVATVLAGHALAFEAETPSEENTVIAFGSCADDENTATPIWNSIYHAAPDAMILMGDNVYLELGNLTAESTIDDFEDDYARLAGVPSFQRLKKEIPTYATWDDNDYGMRDGGAEFPLKSISQRKFAEFWNITGSDRAQTPGIYGSYWVESDSRRVQIILTDSRYFRSPLKRASSSDCSAGDIVPTDDPEANMLGDTQWTWLEQALQADADLHVLVSGIQVLPNEHCFERWGSMPTERRRLLEFVGHASAHTVILSGDRHLGEISELPADHPQNVGYPLVEVTSSPLSARYGWGEGEPNGFRATEDNVRVPNFGVIDINWQEATISFQLRDELGEVKQELHRTIDRWILREE